MKSFFIYILLFIIVFKVDVFAQKKINEKFKKETVGKIDLLLQENYVFPDQAKLIADHLNKSLKEGKFKKYELLDSFAHALTKEVRVVNKDKHLGIWPAFAPVKEQENSNDDYQMYLKNYTDARKQANGFKEVKIINGNIGYLNINFFLAETTKTIDAYMYLLVNTDAVIVDLQDNGGGNPNTVNYLCSYFLESNLLINTLYFRQGNRKNEVITHEVNGKKMIDIPLFIITGSKTFSGAEEFSYNMQSQKRATLVGEVTGGAANPGDVFKINSDLEIFIPTGTGTNSITKTNWEGTGVIPEIKTSGENAYSKAVELASQAAEIYRKKKGSESKNIYEELQRIIDKQTQYSENDTAKIDQQIIDIFRKGVDLNLFGESEINFFGSQNIKKNPLIAESILKSNTVLYPKSPMTYLAYGDMLESNGKKNLALTNFEKSIVLAEEQKAPYLEGLKMRYEKAKSSK
ncbi:S41 family peptidase [Flavobacterium sp. FlaQc-57]|uniref:S41 family peptidase n=1 Tax=Flavobacterium sp. FlaQc-57 TaxID=3374186 RepID=UPI0037564D85